MTIRKTIAALALAGALWGCGDGASPAVRDGSGGSSAATGGAGGLGGGPGTGGQATGGPQGGTIGTGGGPAGVPGLGGSNARGGSGGAATGGSAGGGGSPTCESLGWSPGDASLCGASKGGLECAYCDLPAPPKAGAEPDCKSATAFQGAEVLCVTSCSECK